MPPMASVRDRVLAEVDALADETAAFTTEMVRIPTVNPPGDVYEDCARVIGDRLRAFGFEVQYIAAEGRPGDAIACRENGISAYMRYPINERQLNEAIVAVTGASVKARAWSS